MSDFLSTEMPVEFHTSRCMRMASRSTNPTGEAALLLQLRAVSGEQGTAAVAVAAAVVVETDFFRVDMSMNGASSDALPVGVFRKLKASRRQQMTELHHPTRGLESQQRRRIRLHHIPQHQKKWKTVSQK